MIDGPPPHTPQGALFRPLRLLTRSRRFESVPPPTSPPRLPLNTKSAQAHLLQVLLLLEDGLGHLLRPRHGHHSRRKVVFSPGRLHEARKRFEVCNIDTARRTGRGERKGKTQEGGRGGGDKKKMSFSCAPRGKGERRRRLGGGGAFKV